MSMQGLNKSSATQMNPMNKAGAGWDHDDPNILYDDDFDNEGRSVLYDGVGTAPTMAGQAKSSAVTLTPLTKNIA